MQRLAALLVAVVLAGIVAQAPAATSSDLAHVSPSEWLAAADRGALDVTVGGVGYRLRLEDNPVLEDGAVASLAAEGYDASTIRTLGGSVEGVPGSVVRVTVTPEWAAGYARMPGRTLEILPSGNGSVVARGEGDDDEAGRLEEPAGLDCLGPFALWPIENPAGLVTGWPARTLSMAVAVDSTFVSRNGSTWPAVATAIVNGTDGVFEPQVGVNISVVDMHSHSSSEISSSDSSELLDQVRAHYNTAHASLAREDTMLYVGRDLDGDVVGQANCIGSAGYPTVAYQVVQTVGVTPFRFLGQEFYSNASVKISAHELGHTFNAHHHYGNCVEASRAPLPDACTLMFPTLDMLDERMSSFERLVIRGWAENHI